METPLTLVPDIYGYFNWRMAQGKLPGGRRKGCLVAQRLKTHIEPARFQSGTLNDATAGGAFTGNAKKDFIVKISTAATPDKMQYSTDGGLNWSAAADVTAGAMALEDGVTVLFGATTGHAVDDAWHFSAWPEPTVAEDSVSDVLSAEEAAAYFGRGSIAHLMARAFFSASRFSALKMVTLDDAGGASAATLDLTISGPAEAAGTVKINVSSDQVRLGYAKDDTDAEIALALQNELAKHPELPVYIALDPADATKIKVTAKNKGDLAGSINVSAEVTPLTGVGVAVAAWTPGATDPDVTTALAAAATEKYFVCASAYNDETSVLALRDHIEMVSGPTEKKFGLAMIAETGSLSDALAGSLPLNSGRIINKWRRYTSATKRQYAHFEVAAAWASAWIYHADTKGPHEPMDDVRINGVPPQAPEDRPLGSELEAALWGGVSPSTTDDSLKAKEVRLITTYVKDDQGVEDDSQLDADTIANADYALETFLTIKVPVRLKTPSVKKDVKSQLYVKAKALEDLNMLVNVDAHKDGLTIDDHPTSKGRWEIKVPGPLVEGLHVISEELIIIGG